MSEVIIFRLNKDNPREEMAIQVLKAWSAKGFTIRQTITDALLKLGNPESDFSTDIFIQELKEKLVHVSYQLEQWGQGYFSQSKVVNSESGGTGLSDSLIQSIKKAARPGVKFTN